jgi:hypothetical protein
VVSMFFMSLGYKGGSPSRVLNSPISVNS